MGTQRRSSSSRHGLADALFTPVQQRVLALLFGQPDRSFQSAELIRLARGGTGAVHRQLARLEASGLVTVTRSGNQKHYRANPSSPVFEELHGLVVKTVGVREPLARALAPLADRIKAAFVYGSIAAGSDRADSDLDVMVVSDSLRYDEVYDALLPVEPQLARRISPTVLTTESWRERIGQDSFVRRVSERPRQFLVGSADDLT